MIDVELRLEKVHRLKERRALRGLEFLEWARESARKCSDRQQSLSQMFRDARVTRSVLHVRRRRSSHERPRFVLQPWVGFALLCVYVATALVIAGVMMVRRDA